MITMIWNYSKINPPSSQVKHREKSYRVIFLYIAFHENLQIMIDWIEFYAVSAIFQPCIGGLLQIKLDLYYWQNVY